jgi:hypothetical protein
MHARRLLIRGFFLALLLAAAWGAAGCKTDEEATNEAVRPWNAPKGWETGVPSGMWDRPK